MGRRQQVQAIRLVLVTGQLDLDDVNIQDQRVGAFPAPIGADDLAVEVLERQF